MLDSVTLIVIIISSIFVSILTSITFFLVGYACHGWKQRCKTTGSVSGRQTTSETGPVYYERVVPKFNITSTDHVELKLTKNEAYASLN